MAVTYLHSRNGAVSLVCSSRRRIVKQAHTHIHSDTKGVRIVRRSLRVVRRCSNNSYFHFPPLPAARPVLVLDNILPMWLLLLLIVTIANTSFRYVVVYCFVPAKEKECN